MFKLGKGYSNLQVVNHHDHVYNNNARAVLANFTALTLNQAEHVKPNAPDHLSLLNQHPDDGIKVIN